MVEINRNYFVLWDFGNSCIPLLPVFIRTQQHNLMALHKDNIQCIPLTYSRHFLYYYHGLKTSRKWKIEKQDNTWHVKKIWWFWKKWLIKNTSISEPKTSRHFLKEVFKVPLIQEAFADKSWRCTRKISGYDQHPTSVNTKLINCNYFHVETQFHSDNYWDHVLIFIIINYDWHPTFPCQNTEHNIQSTIITNL